MNLLLEISKDISLYLSYDLLVILKNYYNIPIIKNTIIKIMIEEYIIILTCDLIYYKEIKLIVTLKILRIYTKESELQKLNNHFYY